VDGKAEVAHLLPLLGQLVLAGNDFHRVCLSIALVFYQRHWAVRPDFTCKCVANALECFSMIGGESHGRDLTACTASSRDYMQAGNCQVAII